MQCLGNISLLTSSMFLSLKKKKSNLAVTKPATGDGKFLKHSKLSNPITQSNMSFPAGHFSRHLYNKKNLKSRRT